MDDAAKWVRNPYAKLKAFIKVDPRTLIPLHLPTNPKSPQPLSLFTLLTLRWQHMENQKKNRKENPSPSQLIATNHQQTTNNNINTTQQQEEEEEGEEMQPELLLLKWPSLHCS